MAINQQPRENLLTEAKAYSRRVLLRGSIESLQIDCFFGLRRNGGWSIYFGEDPALHFNNGNQLRRAYLCGQRYESVDGRLFALGRETLGGKVQFNRHRLCELDEQHLVSLCRNSVSSCAAVLAANQFELLGQFPVDDQHLIDDIRLKLNAVTHDFILANMPNA